MKFPKLKHSVLCQLILYAPATAMFWTIGLLALVDEPSNTVSILHILVFFASAGFSLWYLFHNFVLLFGSDVAFAAIRSAKIDRLEYVTDRNGLNREAVEQHVLGRARLWGRSAEVTLGSCRPICLKYRHQSSLAVFYTTIEHRLAVYSVPYLDEAEFRKILANAQMQFGKIPDGFNPFLTKKEKKSATVCRPWSVIILADSIADPVRTLARKKQSSQADGYLMPCVVECSTGKYYVDCTKDYFEPGMMGRPPKNYAGAAVKRLVFGGRLPRENRQTVISSEIDPEMTLWEYIRTVRGVCSDDAGFSVRRVRQLLRKMEEQEIRMEKDAIFCKVKNRLAVCRYTADGPQLTLKLEDKWLSYEKDIFFLRTRKMKKADHQELCKNIQECLRQNGYIVRWES